MYVPLLIVILCLQHLNVVKSDDIDSYEDSIEYSDEYNENELIPKNSPAQTNAPLQVYWNVPTYQCKSKNVYFQNLFEKFGIKQNENDEFIGDKITILYDPGWFPAILKNGTLVNGGVPQEGDLFKHLDKFEEVIEKKVPLNFTGIGVISLSSWRPIFRQNFNDLLAQRNVSYQIQMDVLGPEARNESKLIQIEAKRRFEEAARLFMEKTLVTAKELRPHGHWGFYSFPFCYNMNPNTLKEECPREILQENDQMEWLWSESTALYPIVSESKRISNSQLASQIRGRIQEAARNVQSDSVHNTLILPYFKFSYGNSEFLSEPELTTALETIDQSMATGFIIWGASKDLTTEPKCKKLFDYVENTLGPAIAKYSKQPTRHNNKNDTHNTDDVTEGYFDSNEDNLNSNKSKSFTDVDSTTENIIDNSDNSATDRKLLKVYWNVPTFQCRDKRIHFKNLYKKFGIRQNDNDEFYGEKVTILYHPGMFPGKVDNKMNWNGDVPQMGDLDKHLDKFKKDLVSKIPDKNFNGIGIIDMELWRPILRQSWGNFKPLINISYEIEKKLHVEESNKDSFQKWIKDEATRRFEEAARKFMETSLDLAKSLRPRARWGYYAYPYCFNMEGINKGQENCSTSILKDNDQISWLWSQSTALYPSMYSNQNLSTAQLVSLIRGRLREAARLIQLHSSKSTIILPYIRFKYENNDSEFLREMDLIQILATMYEYNATGIVIWGASTDVNTPLKCNKLLDYVENVLGPAIAKYSIPLKRLSNEDSSVDKPPSLEKPIINFKADSNITDSLKSDESTRNYNEGNIVDKLPSSEKPTINFKADSNITDSLKSDESTRNYNEGNTVDKLPSSKKPTIDFEADLNITDSSNSEESTENDNKDNIVDKPPSSEKPTIDCETNLNFTFSPNNEELTKNDYEDNIVDKPRTSEKTTVDFKTDSKIIDSSNSDETTKNDNKDNIADKSPSSEKPTIDFETDSNIIDSSKSDESTENDIEDTIVNKPSSSEKPTIDFETDSNIIDSSKSDESTENDIEDTIVNKPSSSEKPTIDFETDANIIDSSKSDESTENDIEDTIVNKPSSSEKPTIDFEADSNITDIFKSNESTGNDIFSTYDEDFDYDYDNLNQNVTADASSNILDEKTKSDSYSENYNGYGPRTDIIDTIESRSAKESEIIKTTDSHAIHSNISYYDVDVKTTVSKIEETSNTIINSILHVTKSSLSKESNEEVTTEATSLLTDINTRQETNSNEVTEMKGANDVFQLYTFVSKILETKKINDSNNDFLTDLSKTISNEYERIIQNTNNFFKNYSSINNGVHPEDSVAVTQTHDSPNTDVESYSKSENETSKNTFKVEEKSNPEEFEATNSTVSYNTTDESTKAFNSVTKRTKSQSLLVLLLIVIFNLH